MSKLTKLFGLEFEQKDLDFININTESDTLLFINPTMLQFSKHSILSALANDKVVSFFYRIFDLYSNDREDLALELLNYSNETNELHLGYSKSGKNGRGVSKEALDKLFSAIKENGMLSRDVDFSSVTFIVFVSQFAEDSMSDLIASIIKKELLDFTMQQAKYHGLPIELTNYHYGYFWNEDENKWNELVGPFVSDEFGEAILFTPKDIVVPEYNYSVVHYVEQYIFKWRKMYHLDHDTHLVRTTTLKDGTIRKKEPTNEMLYENEIQNIYKTDKYKRYALDMTVERPDLFKQYLDKVTKKRNNDFLSDDDINDFII